MTTKLTGYRLAKNIADDLDKALLVTDPRLDGHVLINHRDGSILFFDRAFVQRLVVTDHRPGEQPRDTAFAVILTEHHGAHVYHMEDLAKIRAFGPFLPVEDLKIPIEAIQQMATPIHPA